MATATRLRSVALARCAAQIRWHIELLIIVYPPTGGQAAVFIKKNSISLLFRSCSIIQQLINSTRQMESLYFRVSICCWACRKHLEAYFKTYLDAEKSSLNAAVGQWNLFLFIWAPRGFVQVTSWLQCSSHTVCSFFYLNIQAFFWKRWLVSALRANKKDSSCTFLELPNKFRGYKVSVIPSNCERCFSVEITGLLAHRSL